MKELARGYVAALFDGEGTVRFGKSSISIEVSSTDEDIIDRALSFSGLGRKYGPYLPPSMAGKKQRWFWKIEKREEVIQFIRTTDGLISARKTNEFKKVLNWYEERTPKTVPCDFCSSDFQQPHINSKYCTQECTNKAAYQRRKERRAT